MYSGPLHARLYIGRIKEEPWLEVHRPESTRQCLLKRLDLPSPTGEALKNISASNSLVRDDNRYTLRLEATMWHPHDHFSAGQGNLDHLIPSCNYG